MSVGVSTPEPPYFAVIFTSMRTPVDSVGYASTSERMEQLAHRMPGFLGIESARDQKGVGISVSYWSSLEAIHAWRENAEHRLAQELGRERWYEWFRIKVCRVDSVSGFNCSN